MLSASGIPLHLLSRQGCFLLGVTKNKIQIQKSIVIENYGILYFYCHSCQLYASLQPCIMVWISMVLWSTDPRSARCGGCYPGSPHLLAAGSFTIPVKSSFAPGHMYSQALLSLAVSRAWATQTPPLPPPTMLPCPQEQDRKQKRRERGSPEPPSAITGRAVQIMTRQEPMDHMLTPHRTQVEQPWFSYWTV